MGDTATMEMKVVDVVDTINDGSSIMTKTTESVQQSAQESYNKDKEAKEAVSNLIESGNADDFLAKNDANNGKDEAKSDGGGEETSDETEEEKPEEVTTVQTGIPIVSSNKKSRPPYKYDPDKITLRFLFANRDGLTVTLECNPNDTVSEVKGALLSVWPSDLPNCSGGDRLRLICMGKGMLTPDTRTLQDCEVPVFKTHPTPINVSIKPDITEVESAKGEKDGGNRRVTTPGGTAVAGEQASQGCACVIL